MDQALQTPEILTRVLTFMHNDGVSSGRNPLTPLARVNSTWREIVQSIIWAAPPVEALAGIERSRRELFASYIKNLDFGGIRDPTLHTLFVDLHFGRLRKLTLGNPPIEYMNHQSMGVLDGWNLTASQYLQPTLVELQLLLWDSICTSSFFRQIADRCPQLKRIFFSGVGAQLRPDEFLSFFEACRHLEAVELNLGSDFTSSILITADLLLHLSRKPKLDYLELSNSLDQPELFQIIRDQNPTPFTGLTRAVLPVTSAVMSTAAYVLPNVVKLCLILKDGNGSCFRHLTAMPKLRKLKILGTKATSFATQELLALRHLHQLEKLSFSMTDSAVLSGMVAPEFTDADFDLMVSGLSELKKFACEIAWEPRSFSVLTSLSNHCPKLERLRLDGGYDLQLLNNVRKVMFSRLEDLTLDDPEAQGIPVRLTPLQIGRLIDHHAPVLRDLRFMADYDDHPVMRAWWDVAS